MRRGSFWSCQCWCRGTVMHHLVLPYNYVLGFTCTPLPWHSTISVLFSQQRYQQRYQRTIYPRIPKPIKVSFILVKSKLLPCPITACRQCLLCFSLTANAVRRGLSLVFNAECLAIYTEFDNHHPTQYIPFHPHIYQLCSKSLSMSCLSLSIAASCRVNRRRASAIAINIGGKVLLNSFLQSPCDCRLPSMVQVFLEMREGIGESQPVSVMI